MRVHLHAGRDRQQRPHVAGVGDRPQLLDLEVLLHAGGRGVDDRRLAGDGHGLLQRGQRQFDVERRGEPEGELDAFTADGVEPGQLVGDGVGARGQRREPVVAGLRRHRALRTQRRGAGGGHGHARQHCALRVGDATLDRTCAARATALRQRARGDCRGQRHGQQPDEPSLHSYPPWPVGCGLWAGRPRDRLQRRRQRQTNAERTVLSGERNKQWDGVEHQGARHGAAHRARLWRGK